MFENKDQAVTKEYLEYEKKYSEARQIPISEAKQHKLVNEVKNYYAESKRGSE